MKKALCAMLAAALTLSLFGCAKGGSGSGGSAGGASGDVIKLSVFAGSLPENTPTGVGVNYMVQQINEKSGGSIEATAFFDTSLGDATSLVQGLQQGTIDIGVCGDSYYSGLVPEIQAYELPFLFDSIEQARSAVDGESKDVLFQKFEEKGIIGLSFWEGGMRQLSNNVREVKSPADLKGIKMRTLPATVQVETWKALGALPASIDSSELYTALQQGTVQAQENPLSEIVFRAFFEVQPYVSITDHVYTPFMMGASKITWDKLSDEQKQIVQEAAIAGQQKQREACGQAESEARKTLTDNGVTITEDVDKDAFKEIALPVWSVFTDKYGEDLVKMIQEGK